jgi:N-acetylglucosaminyldiphosphoundecaprenol N-acetyl-beta-D-mannosaminyltransferase
VAGLDFDTRSEEQVVAHIVAESGDGRGGRVVTPNIDICRQAKRDPAARALVNEASLIVPDGMPLVWAARLRGDRLTERVTGASLIFTLSAAAAESGRSIYLLGGDPGVPQRAAQELAWRYRGLRVAGADAPRFGFDQRPSEIAAVRERLQEAAPDIVYVGLGFPKQDRVIAELAPGLPGAWFIGCGAAIAFAAGTLPRAPRWVQRLGLEWAYRLMSEPRRLFRRYVVDDLPFAVRLLIASAAARRPGRIRAGVSPAALATQARRDRPGGLGATRFSPHKSHVSQASQARLGPRRTDVTAGRLQPSRCHIGATESARVRPDRGRIGAGSDRVRPDRGRIGAGSSGSGRIGAGSAG